MLWWLPAAYAVPSPEAPCEDIAAKLAAQRLPPRPARPDFWWQQPTPCPSGTTLGGPTPPAAREVWCVFGDTRTGPSTTLSGDLRVSTETRYARDVEVGPRIDWNPATQEAVAWTAYAHDLPHGLAVEWWPTGVVVSWNRKGVKHGPLYKVDLRGQVQLVEFWEDGERTARTCVWRDGALVTDTPR